MKKKHIGTILKLTNTTFSTGIFLRHMTSLSAGVEGQPVWLARALACFSGSGLTAPGESGVPDMAATPVALRPSGESARSDAALPPDPWPISTTRSLSPPKNSMYSLIYEMIIYFITQNLMEPTFISSTVTERFYGMAY